MFFFYLCTYFSQHCIYNIVYSMPHTDNAEKFEFSLGKTFIFLFSRVCVCTEIKKAKKDMLFFVNICTHTHTFAGCVTSKLWLPQAMSLCVRPFADLRHNATQCYTMELNCVPFFSRFLSLFCVPSVCFLLSATLPPSSSPQPHALFP